MPFEGNDIGQVKEIGLDIVRDADFTFDPYDAIVVRRKFGFEFQEFVTLKGEVLYPGRYAIRQGEKIRDLIKKAGGLTNQAFAAGATFTRAGKGTVSISLDKVIKGNNKAENIPLIAGDEILIPTKDFTVEIRIANTEVERYATFSEEYSEKVFTLLMLKERVPTGM